jgi:hypothetical protein
VTDALDLDGRELCPDGACTGVLGDDGVCRVCGAGGVAPVEPAPAAVIEAAEPSFDDDRRLCPDGACVGLLGDDGRCKVCGATAA